MHYKKERAKTIDKMIINVNKSWEEYRPETLYKFFLTHQAAMGCIITRQGNNDYRIFHCGKDKLENKNKLPELFKLIEIPLDALTESNYFFLLVK